MPIVIVDGLRGVGKTTSARRLVNSTLWLPADLERLAVDPMGLLAALTPPVLIDEWQLAGVDLLWALKRLVDDDPTPGRFVLTGSVEPATYGPTYPLTGRAASVVMRPMTHAELDGRGGDETWLRRVVGGEQPATTSGRSPSFGYEMLVRTGFPAARHLRDADIFLDGYSAVLAQRAGDEGRDASRLLRALRVLATLESQAVPDQRIWDAADIDKATWKAYDDLLDRTHLTTSLPSFETNRLKRLTSYSKRHLADAALALRLAGLDAERAATDPSAFGPYFESMVLQQLRPQVDGLGATMSHLRTGSGEREVDAVVEVGLDVFGFEVKLGTAPSVRDARHLAWLRDGLGDRFAAGFVVHTGGDSVPLGDRLWAVPIDTIC